MIKLLIVHEFPVMCNIISSVLDSEPDIKVVGCASGVDEAYNLAMQNEVNLVLISTRLPDDGAIRLTNLLVQRTTPIKVLILGITESRESVLQYVESGASGYVLRESSLEELLTTIRAVSNDQALISPEIAATLIQRVSEFARAFSQAGLTPPPDSISLTPRELQVLALLNEKLTNQEIAERLVIETGTVKNHVHSILRKLGVSNRDDASNLASILRENRKGKQE